MTLQPFVRTPLLLLFPALQQRTCTPASSVPAHGSLPCSDPPPSPPFSATDAVSRTPPPLTDRLLDPAPALPPRPSTSSMLTEAPAGRAWSRRPRSPPLSPTALPPPHPSSTGPSGGSPRRRRPRPGRRPAPASRLSWVRPLLGYGRPLPRPCARSPVARLALWATAQWFPRPPFLKKGVKNNINK